MLDVGAGGGDQLAEVLGVQIDEPLPESAQLLQLGDGAVVSARLRRGAAPESGATRAATSAKEYRWASAIKDVKGGLHDRPVFQPRSRGQAVPKCAGVVVEPGDLDADLGALGEPHC